MMAAHTPWYWLPALAPRGAMSMSSDPTVYVLTPTTGG